MKFSPTMKTYVFAVVVITLLAGAVHRAIEESKPLAEFRRERLAGSRSEATSRSTPAPQIKNSPAQDSMEVQDGTGVIQDFESYYDTRDLAADVAFIKANTAVDLGTTAGVGNSQSLKYTGSPTKDDFVCQAEYALPVGVGLAGTGQVTMQVKHLEGPCGLFQVQLKDRRGATLATGPRVATHMLASRFATYRMDTAGITKDLHKIAVFFESDYTSGASFAIDNITAVETAIPAGTTFHKNLIVIEDFESYASAADLSSEISFIKTNTAVDLGTADGVGGSQSFNYTGNTATDEFYCQAELELRLPLSLQNIRQVMLQVKCLAGSNELLQVELKNAWGDTVATGPQVATYSLNSQFTTYRIDTSGAHEPLNKIAVFLRSSDGDISSVAIDHIVAIEGIREELVVIEDFESYLGTVDLVSDISLTKNNTTVELETSGGVGGSQFLSYTGNAATDGFFSHADFELGSNVNLSGIDRVTFQVRYLAGSNELLQIQLKNEYGAIIAIGPEVETKSLFGEFTTHTIDTSKTTEDLKKISIFLKSLDGGTSSVAIDNIALAVPCP